MPTSGTRVPGGGRSKGIKSSKRKAKRTPTEIGQLVPTSKKGERKKTQALRKARRVADRKVDRAAYLAQLQQEAETRGIQRRVNRPERQQTTRRVIRSLERTERREERPTTKLVYESDREAAKALGELGKGVGEELAHSLSASEAAKRGAEITKTARKEGVPAALLKAAPEALYLLPGARASKTVGRALEKAGAKVGERRAAAEAARSTKKAVARNARKSAPKTKPKAEARYGKTRTLKNKAKGRARQGAGKVRERYAPPARKARRAERQAGAANAITHPGTAFAGTTDAGNAFIEGTGKAITEDPGKTLKTTGRALYGAPAAFAADVVDLATGNVGEFVESQKQYIESLKPLASGDPEKVSKAIKEDVGLAPHLGVALTGVGVAKSALRGRKVSAPSVSKAVMERDVRLAEQGKTPAIRREARRRLNDNRYAEPIQQRRKGSRREAERSATVGEEQMALQAIEMRKGGKRRGIKRQRLEHEIADLDRHQLTENVTEGDVLQVLGRYPDLTLDEVKGVLADLREASREINTDDVHTRAVLEAIVANPHVLKSKRINQTLERLRTTDEGRSIEVHTERTGRRQTTRDPNYERARRMPYARAQRIPLPEERIPSELQGVTKVRPGKRAETRIRASAKKAVRRAAKLEAIAKELRSQGRTRRAEQLEARAARDRARAEKQLAVVDRFRKAESKEIQAGRLEAEGDVRGAAALRGEANNLRRKGEADQRQRLSEFVNETDARLAEQGKRQPIYFTQKDVARMDRVPDTGVPSTRGTKKEQYRSGTLLEQGRIDESARTLVESLNRGRAVIAERKRQRGFIEEVPLKLKGERFFAGPEITAARKGGKVPPGYEAVPIQEFAAAIQKNDALRREVDLKRNTAEGMYGERRLYMLVPRKQIKEYRLQAEQLGTAWRRVRTTTRAQALLMLAGSVPWFVMQVPATALVMALKHPNPLRWARAARNGVYLLRHSTPEERASFWAHFGANPSDFLAIGDNVRGINPTTNKSFYDATQLAFRSPAGRMVRALGKHLKEGGPLIKANRAYEEAMRKLEVLMEVDRLSGVNASGKPQAFALSVSRLSTTVGRHLEQMRGLTTPQQIRAYLDNPELMRDLETEVFDAVGNWSAMTHAEKKFAAVATFMPFLRFSLNWIAKFPTKNPIKTAVYIQLGQQNAQELADLLGGDPSFWTGWAMAVTHVGGEPQIVDLARAMPGGNVFIESAAGGQNIIQAGFRALQPAVGSTIAAAFGKDQYGRSFDASEDPDDPTFVEQVARNLVTLTPYTRPLRDKIGPDPSEISQLFRELEDRSGLERALLPDVFPDIEREAEAARIGRLLEQTFDAPTDEEKKATPYGTPERKALMEREKAADKAWDEIQKLLVQYGVQTKQAQRKDKRLYETRVKGWRSSGTSGGLGGGGLGSGGLGGGGL